LKFAGRRCVIGAVCLVVLVLFVVGFVPLCFAVSFDEAAETIGRAESDLGSAFVAVAAAEGAGADVSLLLDKLDAAGVFLSEAHSAFRVGNYEGAFSSAVACSSAVEGVVGEGARLKVDAEISHNTMLLLTVVVTGVGVGLLLVFAFFGWRFLKRKYFRRILDMKPQMEVTK
jgi:hypothetical protein